MILPCFYCQGLGCTACSRPTPPAPPAVELVQWTCSGCSRVVYHRRYPTLCRCGGEWRAPEEPKTDPDQKLCEGCTFTLVKRGQHCKYCDRRRSK